MVYLSVYLSTDYLTFFQHDDVSTYTILASLLVSRCAAIAAVAEEIYFKVVSKEILCFCFPTFGDVKSDWVYHKMILLLYT